MSTYTYIFIAFRHNLSKSKLYNIDHFNYHNIRVAVTGIKFSNRVSLKYLYNAISKIKVQIDILKVGGGGF